MNEITFILCTWVLRLLRTSRNTLKTGRLVLSSFLTSWKQSYNTRAQVELVVCSNVNYNLPSGPL